MNILMYARARQIVGEPMIELELPDGATVADLRTKLGAVYPALAPLLSSILVAVNQEFAVDSDRLSPDAEIALIPPVSGGFDG